jgi:hypothetical protein
MADDNRSQGYRAGDPYARPKPQASTPAAGDPLAELARLIGQQNDSNPSYRQTGSWVPPGQADRRSAPAVDPYAQPVEPYADPAYGQGAPYGQQPHTDPRYADPRYADPQAFAPQYVDPQHDPRYVEMQGYATGHPDPARYPAGHDPQAYDAQGYGAQGYAPQAYPPQAYGAHDPQSYGAQGHDAQGYAAQGYDPHAFADPRYADPYYAQQMPQGGVPHDPLHMQHAQEPVSSSRRRGNIVTVLAVFALAVVGTAAAFGYRAMFGISGTAMPPPVIKADTKPTKIVPATDASTKPIQDRVGVKTERIVPREEQPVELRDPARAGNTPRVIFPNLAGQNQAPAQTVASIVPSTSTPSTGSAEPKKIRTVAIKPDQPAELPGGRPAAAAPSRAASEPEAAAPRNGMQGNAPLPLSPQQTQPHPAATQAPAPQRQAARPSAGNGSPFPTPIGNAVSAAGGAYAVQVTSQRSEADAQAAYKSLQAQFPSVLGGRQAVIRRADLGDKGTYYRAQIGPFGSQGEASEFCGSLKAAGGQCVVQRN